MKSFEFLCLFCLRAFCGERSISGIYHLLRGKKSSQTIQDANIFSLGILYGLFPDLNRDFLLQNIKAIASQNQIVELQADHYEVTERGMVTLAEYEKMYPLAPYLNGFSYKDKSSLFWKRYSLLVQTLSNLAGSESSFLPIQYEDTVQRWVKNHLLHQKGRSKEQLLHDLYHETNCLLQQVTTSQATVFTLMLTGHRQVGRTAEQIAKILHGESFWVQVEIQSVLHFIIGSLEKEEGKVKYPYLHSLCRDLLARPQLTETTQKSLKLLNQGLDLNDIAKVRRLKLSTIEDHIVEIAMHSNHLSIESYVEKEIIEEIKEVIHDLHTHQLRRIKEKLTNQDISYFQIRLVLTRMVDGDESRESARS
ncbi:hypothetical protein AB685_02700 [Bacillus sp. LL01]|uniref:helix-turn-helix domain-containing protein n=1 Tax=Bacillus sp. LL01 TaxID=1665556 RepID=UPI00064D6A0F|nr:helix-turn-helix domain-containing protein [Bacillus sp. LL01]KMJ59790.1 hypothetical protein AB685_02700 [Bacillus sp. LL01]